MCTVFSEEELKRHPSHTFYACVKYIQYQINSQASVILPARCEYKYLKKVVRFLSIIKFQSQFNKNTKWILN